MFKPKYLICLDKRAFPKEQGVCLGSQLAAIVKMLSTLIKQHVWLCSDVDAFSPIPQKLGINSFKLKELGDDQALADLCKNIDQFLSGVFIATEKKPNAEYPDLYLDTEDKQFRPLELDGALLEIRTFDTSYFEIYSEDKKLMNELSKTYDIEIEMDTAVQG